MVNILAIEMQAGRKIFFALFGCTGPVPDSYKNKMIWKYFAENFNIKYRALVISRKTSRILILSFSPMTNYYDFHVKQNLLPPMTVYIANGILLRKGRRV